MKARLLYPILMALCLLSSCKSFPSTVEVANPDSARAVYAGEKLAALLAAHDGYRVRVGCWKDAAFRSEMEERGLVPAGADMDAKEAFFLHADGSEVLVCGSDESGELYGCLELCSRLEGEGGLPRHLSLFDRPEMVMRGTCIGIQKTYYLPGRTVYEYPYTEENFPWFYDKELWIKYLDMMVENRMNALYLWNGHPFASLVKLPDYPYALEVSEEDFRRNEEMFGFLTAEADKRGIWVIQMFYNIIVSKPFAEYHHIPTQNRNVKITPLLSDYTRKSIAAFVEKYPNVGLLVCLGEAMNTWDDDVQWFTETIIPGVQDGLRALGKEEEPPIVLRAHDTNCEMVMDAALPIYRNLYTMNKYNGESLCTYEPRGPWTETHRALSALGSIHIENVHILANLEPFRYGAPGFIRKSVIAMHEVHGANGLHLYPQASYWDWPYSADRLEDGGRLLEMDRDWIWYKAWGRYAWDCDRDPDAEDAYWSGNLADYYGCSAADARRILTAYEESGEISPKLLRKFGITEGNRETFLLGMFMSQLVNPNRWTVYPDFANSCGPLGEKLEVWAEKEFKGEAHEGTDLPPLLIAQVREHARKALAAIEKVRSVRINRDEFERLRNDIRCYEAFAASFTDKLEAAMDVLMYSHNGDRALLDHACVKMESSLEHFRRLVELGDSHYLYANSMQTSQRRIPASGAGGRNKLWGELLPQYERELETFRTNIRLLDAGNDASKVQFPAFRPARVRILSPKDAVWIPVQEGAQPFLDSPGAIVAYAPEIADLQILQTDTHVQRDAHTVFTFEAAGPVTLWVGYYNPISPSNRYLPAPKLETDASANDYGQADVQIANAIEIAGSAAVNLHAFHFPAGRHTVDLGKGMCLVFGFAEPATDFKAHDAGLKEFGDIDWLFY